MCIIVIYQVIKQQSINTELHPIKIIFYSTDLYGEIYYINDLDYQNEPKIEFKMLTGF